jgi:predicted enzyme related to lactoylglutathione lyase
MIRGVHALFYSSKPDEARDFFKNKLRLPFSDVGEGWLIFDFAEGDLGVHPTEDASDSGTHNVSFYCDDIEATVADLESRGVRLDPVQDHGYGLVTHMTAPGGIRIQLYQPRYQKSSSAKKKATPKKATPKKAKKAKKAKRPAPTKQAAKGKKRR